MVFLQLSAILMWVGIAVIGITLLFVVWVMIRAALMRRLRPILPAKTEAFVELGSGALVAFDVASEGVRYLIPDFRPGVYRVPLEAVRRAPRDLSVEHPESVIAVDTATIYLVDADYYDRLGVLLERLFAETDSYDLTAEQCEVAVKELGIKFDYLEGRVGFGDFSGDGGYTLDVSRIEFVRGTDG